MAKLPKYTLSKDKTRNDWALTDEASKRTVKRFATKAEATKRGVLANAVRGTGSVRIRKENGRIQEERTFPRSRDPRSSKG
jgi:hypothetical protein